jgi:hypothetical protein
MGFVRQARAGLATCCCKLELVFVVLYSRVRNRHLWMLKISSAPFWGVMYVRATLSLTVKWDKWMFLRPVRVLGRIGTSASTTSSLQQCHSRPASTYPLVPSQFSLLIMFYRLLRAISTPVEGEGGGKAPIIASRAPLWRRTARDRDIFLAPIKNVPVLSYCSEALAIAI